VPGKVLFASWARRAELVPVAVTLATFDVTFAMRATKRPALSPGGPLTAYPSIRLRSRDGSWSDS